MEQMNGPKLIKEVNQQIAKTLDSIAAQKGRSDLMILNVINNEIRAIGDRVEKFVQDNIRLFEENVQLRTENEKLMKELAEVGEKQLKEKLEVPSTVGHDV